MCKSTTITLIYNGDVMSFSLGDFHITKDKKHFTIGVNSSLAGAGSQYGGSFSQFKFNFPISCYDDFIYGLKNIILDGTKDNYLINL